MSEILQVIFYQVELIENQRRKEMKIEDKDKKN